MEKTKIQLLPLETGMIQDAGIILTKNAIMQKLKIFLEEIQVVQKSIIENNSPGFPKEVLHISPKVSRGENYRGLPWLVLDYPRHFELHNVFAIRTMFWWGNFFSTTLHLSGTNKELIEPKIIGNKSWLDKNDFFVCINQHEWEHHFEKDNYILINEITDDKFEEIIRNKKFLKLAKKKSLEKISEMENILCKNYAEIVSIIS